MEIDVAVAESTVVDSEVDKTRRRALSNWRATSVAKMLFVEQHAGAEKAVRAVVVWPGPQPLLTDTCVLFDHFGLQVAGQRVLPARRDGDPTAVSLFEFRAPDDWRPGSPARVAAAFEAHHNQVYAIDEYARLIVSADVGWREVMLVRSAARFLHQAGMKMSQSYVVATLQGHPHFVTTLVAYFHARFDPDLGDRDSVVAETLGALGAAIEATITVDEDRILRTFGSFVSSVLRTNWFQLGADGKPMGYSSFLLNSAALQPRVPVVPFREIFVDSDDVEGIHARSGPVARGGLRFSDRPEDYRTEVLGLMKTQTVKNSPIVPVGAKGAFVRKNPSIAAENAYKTFISGLLDVTDNLVEGEVRHPPRTVVYGGENSYLVVAADKGTAKLSDVANEVAIERGHWLGDAFASGGSTGYDHKAMGITARGAWVSVRRHFADLGVDVERDQLRTVGIGDMSGDVFGNGMLLSRNICLIAAFDHRHIFLDPNPDPEVGYRERARLAQMTASSWADYSTAALSAGGGVWPRTAKRIKLSEPARAAVGVTAESFTPVELIRAILCADVDLLWNGGIGTYVKSRRESNADVADPANDVIRVDGVQLQARVVAEGGNLGFTQLGRVEYALCGGRINTDFIDNATGVATSDREVNLKIALDTACRDGLMVDSERNRLLADAQQEVTDAVLEGADKQVLAISLAEAQAAQLLNRHERLIENLEEVSGINRGVEMLPTRAELVSRVRDGRGLTRPEIALLLAHSKNVVRDELLASNVPDDPVFEASLQRYFPTRIRQRVAPAIGAHRLSREIIATQLADDLINHVGPGFIYQLDERLDVSTPDAAAAYTIVKELFDVDTMWRESQNRACSSQPQQWEALHSLQQFIEHAASRLLRYHRDIADIGAIIDLYRPHIGELAAFCGSRWERIRLEAFDLSRIATELAAPISDVAHTYQTLTELLDLEWIIRGLTSRSATNWWEAMGVAAVRDALADTHHRLAAVVIRFNGDDKANRWEPAMTEGLLRFRRMRAELGRDNVIDLARASTVHAELMLLCRRTENLLR